MSPVVVIILILLGIGAAYFTMSSLADAQIAAGSAANPMLTNYATLACKILIGVLLLYAIYYIVDTIKTSIQQRKYK